MLDAYHSAVTMLARREHGAVELMRKLSKKGYSAEDIQATIDTCQRLGLQDDERFIEQKIRTRIAQGYGPERIRLELQQLGISRDMLDGVWMAEAYDWFATAQAALQKKYGRHPVASNAIRQKQRQFLYYRGFSMDIIAEVLKEQGHNENS